VRVYSVPSICVCVCVYVCVYNCNLLSHVCHRTRSLGRHVSDVRRKVPVSNRRRGTSRETGTLVALGISRLQQTATQQYAHQ
jgi:hypothetical protein